MYRSEASQQHDGKDAPMQTNPTRLLLLAAESGDAAAQLNLVPFATAGWMTMAIRSKATARRR
jgi:hypothetical protein